MCSLFSCVYMWIFAARVLSTLKYGFILKISISIGWNHHHYYYILYINFILLYFILYMCIWWNNLQTPHSLYNVKLLLLFFSSSFFRATENCFTYVADIMFIIFYIILYIFIIIIIIIFYIFQFHSELLSFFSFFSSTNLYSNTFCVAILLVQIVNKRKILIIMKNLRIRIIIVIKNWCHQPRDGTQVQQIIIISNTFSWYLISTHHIFWLTLFFEFLFVLFF